MAEIAWVVFGVLMVVAIVLCVLLEGGDDHDHLG